MATAARATRKTDWDARMYPLVINGVEVLHPSPTTHLNIIAKPLTNWAAKSEKTMMLNRLREFLKSSVGVGPFNLRGYLLEELNAIDKAPLAYRGISSKAADIGTCAHAWIEWYIDRELGIGLGDEPILLPGADRCIEGFKAWAKEVDFEPICSETTVFNTPERYAGTYDGKGRVRGEIVMMDWKTSAGIYNEYLLQVHAYMAADRFLMGPAKAIDKAVIVRFAKTADDKTPFEVREVPYNPETFRAYLAARDLWEWQRKAEGKSVGGPWA